MTAPRLSTRIQESGLAPDVARTFADGLRQVMGEDGADGTTKAVLIGRLLGALKEGPAPAPFEALWPHGELFLTGCITVAVSDGEYRVEEARLISHFAHGLGLSARQLADLEARVFGQLAARGADVRRRQGSASGHDAPEPGALKTEEAELTEPKVAGTPRASR
jgi:hypothetical protein